MARGKVVKPEGVGSQVKARPELAAPAAGAPVASAPAPLSDAATAPANPSSEEQRQTEITRRVRDLVRLAREQGHLSQADIQESMPDLLSAPGDLDEVFTQLRALDIEIQEAPDPDRSLPTPEDEGRVRLDILDDPVRMYFKQMGQAPLLTRQQEVEI